MLSATGWLSMNGISDGYESPSRLDHSATLTPIICKSEFLDVLRR